MCFPSLHILERALPWRPLQSPSHLYSAYVCWWDTPCAQWSNSGCLQASNSYIYLTSKVTALPGEKTQNPLQKKERKLLLIPCFFFFSYVSLFSLTSHDYRLGLFTGVTPAAVYTRAHRLLQRPASKWLEEWVFYMKEHFSFESLSHTRNCPSSHICTLFQKSALNLFCQGCFWQRHTAIPVTLSFTLVLSVNEGKFRFWQ